MYRSKVVMVTDGGSVHRGRVLGEKRPRAFSPALMHHGVAVKRPLLEMKSPTAGLNMLSQSPPPGVGLQTMHLSPSPPPTHLPPMLRRSYSAAQLSSTGNPLHMLAAAATHSSSPRIGATISPYRRMQPTPRRPVGTPGRPVGLGALTVLPEPSRLPTGLYGAASPQFASVGSPLPVQPMLYANGIRTLGTIACTALQQQAGGHGNTSNPQESDAGTDDDQETLYLSRKHSGRRPLLFTPPQNHLPHTAAPSLARMGSSNVAITVASAGDRHTRKELSKMASVERGSNKKKEFTKRKILKAFFRNKDKRSNAPRRPLTRCRQGRKGFKNGKLLWEWAEENLHNPFMDGHSKKVYAQKCNFTVSQVATWLNNFRKRIYKPLFTRLVEEARERTAKNGGTSGVLEEPIHNTKGKNIVGMVDLDELLARIKKLRPVNLFPEAGVDDTSKDSASSARATQPQKDVENEVPVKLEPNSANPTTPVETNADTPTEAKPTPDTPTAARND